MNFSFADDPPAAAEEIAEDEGSIFMRVRRDENGDPISMDTSIVTYTLVDEDGQVLTVDLIGAVHVGDEAYYDELNTQFALYEALLYELVSSAEGDIPDGERSNHPVAGVQGIMQSMLELSHQLAIVDYTAENFVHADMSIQEFNDTMEERGESWLQMYFQAMGQSMAQQSQAGGGPSDVELLMALFSENRALMLKRLMAEQFDGMEGMDIFTDEDGSTIITERNGKALEVLDEQIEAGVRHIGIFYGAGHMEDFDQRLIEDYGLERGEVRWVVAWDLTDEGTARDVAEEDEDATEPAEDVEAEDAAAERNELVPAGA